MKRITHLLVCTWLIFVVGCASHAIRQAAFLGDLGKVQALAAKGADINDSFENVGTTLHQATLGDHVEIVEWLLANGARVDATTTTGLTSLHTAAEKGHLEIAKLLLNRRANVNARDAFGETPLHFSTAHGHVEVTDLLLANGADVNARRTNGLTALHSAVAVNSAPMVKSLVNKGADVRAIYGGGITPLHFAVEKSFLLRSPPALTPIVQMLLAAGAQPTALTKTAGLGTTEVMRAGAFKVYAEYLERSGSPENAISYYNQAAEIYGKMPQNILIHANNDPEAFYARNHSLLGGGNPDFETYARQLAEECRGNVRRLTQTSRNGTKPPS